MAKINMNKGWLNRYDEGGMTDMDMSAPEPMAPDPARNKKSAKNKKRILRKNKPAAANSSETTSSIVEPALPADKHLLAQVPIAAEPTYSPDYIEPWESWSPKRWFKYDYSDYPNAELANASALKKLGADQDYVYKKQIIATKAAPEKKQDPKTSATYDEAFNKYYNFIKENEGSVKDKKTGLFIPYPSPEDDGTYTVGYGHKLKKGQENDPMFKNGLTEEQVSNLFKDDFQTHYGNVVNFLGEDYFTKLPYDQQMMLTDYNFNTKKGLPGFPKFVSAIKAYNDASTEEEKEAQRKIIAKEYSRKYEDEGTKKDEPLYKRNSSMLDMYLIPSFKIKRAMTEPYKYQHPGIKEPDFIYGMVEPIDDNRGQWAHPGKVTRIHSPDITMSGVNYAMLGVGADGEKQMMYPNKNYRFKQPPVTEYPIIEAKNGGWLTQYQKAGTVMPADVMMNPKKLAQWMKDHPEATVTNADKQVIKNPRAVNIDPRLLKNTSKVTSKQETIDYPASDPRSQSYKGNPATSLLWNPNQVQGEGARALEAGFSAPIDLAAGASLGYAIGAPVLAAMDAPIVAGAPAYLTANNMLTAAMIPAGAKALSFLPADVQSGNLRGFTEHSAEAALNLLPLGASSAPFIRSGINYAGKALGTEEGLLSNTWRLNPKAYQYNLPENTMWRGLGQEGMEDAIESGVFRAKQNVVPEYYPGTNLQLNKSFGTKPYFTPRFNTAATYGDRYLAEVPRSAANWRSRYKRSDWSQVADRPIPINEGRILEKHWLQGYKPISVPKSSFKSEIDWAKWNAEIPANKALMEEYLTIEQQAKANGTWMKNPDGSAFQGTPEQFVQQQSSNFKKAFGNSKLLNPDGSPMIVYHGSAKKFNTFDPSKFQLGDAGYSGSGIYTTPSKTKANSYSLSSAKLHTGDIEPTVYELYGQANNPISSEQLIKQGDLDLFNFNRQSAPINQQLLGYDAAIHNQQRGIERIRPWNDAWEIVFPTNKQLKSAVGNNGMFDMTNPNIYKSVLPYVIPAATVPTILQNYQGLQKHKDGGWLLDKYQDGNVVPANPDFSSLLNSTLDEIYGAKKTTESVPAPVQQAPKPAVVSPVAAVKKQIPSPAPVVPQPIVQQAPAPIQKTEVLPQGEMLPEVKVYGNALRFPFESNSSFKAPYYSVGNPNYKKSLEVKSTPILKDVENKGINWVGEINNALGSVLDVYTSLEEKLDHAVNIAYNGIMRKYKLYTGKDDDKEITASNKPKSVKEYYNGTSGNILDINVGNSDRLYRQQTLPLSNVVFGYRNRGDFKDIDTEGLEVTTFHPFTEKNKLKDGQSIIALDPQGHIHVGKYGDFKNQKGYLFSPTYENKIVDFYDDQVKPADRTNPGYVYPKVKVIGDNNKQIDGSLSLLMKDTKSRDRYGDVQGGRILVVKNNQVYLLSGTVQHIADEFRKLKGDSPYLEVYSLDNGTYNKGLAYKNKKITAKQFKEYDELNSSGGNGLYIVNYGQPVYKYKQDYVENMPNIRNESDESYKQGHALKNEIKNIILHHTAYTNDATNSEEVRKQYMTPNQSSSHIVIEEDGTRTIYASPEQVTFHAGESSWNGRTNVNDFGIGVEFQGDTTRKPLTDAQIESFYEYFKDLSTRYGLSLKDVITHQMIAPGRKPDITESEYKRVIDYGKTRGYYKDGGTTWLTKYQDAGAVTGTTSTTGTDFSSLLNSTLDEMYNSNKNATQSPAKSSAVEHLDLVKGKNPINNVSMAKSIPTSLMKKDVIKPSASLKINDVPKTIQDYFDTYEQNNDSEDARTKGTYNIVDQATGKVYVKSFDPSYKGGFKITAYPLGKELYNQIANFAGGEQTPPYFTQSSNGSAVPINQCKLQIIDGKITGSCPDYKNMRTYNDEGVITGQFTDNYIPEMNRSMGFGTLVINSNNSMEENEKQRKAITNLPNAKTALISRTNDNEFIDNPDLGDPRKLLKHIDIQNMEGVISGAWDKEYLKNHPDAAYGTEDQKKIYDYEQYKKEQEERKKKYGGWLTKYQNAGRVKPIIVPPGDPRLQSYQDSMNVYLKNKPKVDNYLNFVKAHNLLSNEYIPLSDEKIKPIKGHSIWFQQNDKGEFVIDKNRHPTSLTINDLLKAGIDKQVATMGVHEYKKPIRKVLTEGSVGADNVRKQEELVNAGYNITVDGDWGPKSQKAWDDYQQKINAKKEQWQPNQEDLRADGTQKGTGYLGVMKRPDGGVSSEISIGVEIDGKEVEIPSMVPTLNKEELDYLLNNPVNKPDLFDTNIGKSIMDKAYKHAMERMDKGLSPFYQEGEPRQQLPSTPVKQTVPPEPRPSFPPGATTVPDKSLVGDWSEETKKQKGLRTLKEKYTNEDGVLKTRQTIYDSKGNVLETKEDLPGNYKRGGVTWLNEYAQGGEVFSAGGEKHKVYKKESPTGNGKGVKGHIMVTHPTKDKGKWDTIDLTKIAGAKTVAQGVASTKKWHKENPEYKLGGWLKSYK